MPVANALRLNETQVAEYRREGYLVYPEPTFSQAKSVGLKSHFEQTLAAVI